MVDVIVGSVVAAMARDVAADLNLAAKVVHRLAKDPIRTTVAHREPRVKTTAAY